jgi:FkbM family methyltransferase
MAHELGFLMTRFYGEKGVDECIRNAFFPDYSYKGVFVEVGAAGPEFLSMSMHFREHGWRVIGIEPNPEFCKLHHEKGYEILQYACGDHDEDNVEFFVVDSQGAAYNGGKVSYESFSSLGLKSSYAELKSGIDQQKIYVKLRRLDTILETHAPDVKHIDILSVDVEGWELEVIDGLNTERYRPRLMVIENLFSSNKYIRYMKERGYFLWKRAYPNDVYLRRDMVASRFGRLWLSLYSSAVLARNWRSREKEPR